MKKSIYQLLANLLIWLCIPIVIVSHSLIKNGLNVNPIPDINKLYKSLDTEMTVYFLVAFLMYFVVFSGVHYFSEKKSEKTRAIYFTALGMDEIVSLLLSTGSLLGVYVVASKSNYYLLTLTVLFYGIALSGYEKQI